MLIFEEIHQHYYKVTHKSHMAQTGPEGGCMAQKVPANEIYENGCMQVDEEDRNNWRDPHLVGEKFSRLNILELCVEARNGKTVTKGSPTKEIWQMIHTKGGPGSIGTVKCWNKMYNKQVITKKW